MVIDKATSRKRNNDIVTYMNRVKGGAFKKQQGQADKEGAANALVVYQSLAECEKDDFYDKFKENKKKGWSWVRTFADQLKKAKTEVDTVKEKYMTRIVGLGGGCIWGWVK